MSDVERDLLEDAAVGFLTRRGPWHAEVSEVVPTRALAVRDQIRALLADLPRARRDLETYVQKNRGRLFDVLTASTPRDVITAQDLVAVGALSATIPIEAAGAILGPDHAELTRLLADVRADRDIWAASDADLVPALALWDRLDGHTGMGRVRTSKLLAAKRPRLIPMWDRYAKAALNLRDDDNQWLLWRAALDDEDTRELVERATPPAAQHLSLVRRLDIVAWRRGEDRARADRGTTN